MNTKEALEIIKQVLSRPTTQLNGAAEAQTVMNAYNVLESKLVEKQENENDQNN